MDIVFSQELSDHENPASVLEELYQSIVGHKHPFGAGDLVLIKPNFVAPFRHATTDFEFIEFFITKIQEMNAVPVVGESSGYEFDTEKTLHILGVYSFLRDRGVEILNFEQHGFMQVALGQGLPSVEVAEVALEAKLIINLPVLKEHSITKVTGAVKNLFGLLSKSSRRKLHCRYLHKGIARLASMIGQTLHFVDARRSVTRAVFGELNPLGYCLAGTNPFVLDHFGSRLLGVNPDAVLHLNNVPIYELQGAVPNFFLRPQNKESYKEKFHRIMYSVFYWMDEVKCSLVNGNSILPTLHWYLGFHPVLRKHTEEELAQLAELCPADAISLEKRCIIRERCATVRCLRCYLDGPQGSVKLKGLNPPKSRMWK